MLLYVMRHGPSEDHAPSGLDADRRLTPDGRELVTVAAQELSRRVSAGLARIFSSPLARARETAELMRGHLAPEGLVVVRDELVPGDEPPFDFVRELVALEGHVMIVGHQPGLESLVRTLSDGAGRGVMPFGFRTAMVMGLEIGHDPRAPGVDPLGLGRWRLRMVLDPRTSSVGQ